MILRLILPIIERVPVTIGAVVLFGLYACASLAIRSFIHSYFSYKNRYNYYNMLSSFELNKCLSFDAYCRKY